MYREADGTMLELLDLLHFYTKKKIIVFILNKKDIYVFYWSYIAIIYIYYISCMVSLHVSAIDINIFMYLYGNNN